MAGKQNPTTRQHYIPQSYLRNFTSTPLLDKSKQQIFVYDKVENWVKELPIKHVGWEKNMYAFDWGKTLSCSEYLGLERSQALDSTFTNLIEPLQQRTIAEIENVAKSTSFSSFGDEVFLSDTLITPEIKEKLASCIVFQYLRTKEIKDNFERIGSKVYEQLQYLKKYYEENSKFKITEKYLDVMNAHKQMAEGEDLRGLLMTEIFKNEKLTNSLIEKMYGYVFLFGVNTSDYTLMTSDSPVIIIGHDATNRTPYFGGFGTEIIFPLSSNIVLSAVDPVFFSNYIKYDRCIIKEHNANESILRCNSYQYKGAERFVFSSKNEFSAVIKAGV